MINCYISFICHLPLEISKKLYCVCVCLCVYVCHIYRKNSSIFPNNALGQRYHGKMRIIHPWS